MQLEDYFDVQAPDDIRLKGHRIGIEHVLYEYIHRAQPAEDIAKRFPTLRLDQIYATILYYLTRKEQVDRYLTDWLEHSERMYAEQLRNPPPGLSRFLERVRKLKAEREKQPA